MAGGQQASPQSYRRRLGKARAAGAWKSLIQRLHRSDRAAHGLGVGLSL